MSDLKLDPATGDIDVDDTSSSPRMLTAGEEIQAIAQRLTIRLRTFLGEWFLDQRKGVPWLQILGAKNAQGVAVAILRDAIRKTPGIVSVDLLTLDLDSERLATIDLKATTTAGPLDLSGIELSPAPAVSDPWTPQQLVDSGDLAFWWDPSDEATVTREPGFPFALSQVDDLSGNARHLQPCGDDNGPDVTYAPGLVAGLLVFDGVTTLNLSTDADQVFTPSGYISTAEPISVTRIFIVARWDGPSAFAADAALIGETEDLGLTEGRLLTGAAASMNFANETDLSLTISVDGAAADDMATPVAALPALSTLGIISIANTDPASAIELNGVMLGCLPLAFPAPFTPQHASPWNGVIGETIGVSGTISEKNARRIEGYLAWRAGTQAKLPTTHPYRFAAPTIDD